MARGPLQDNKLLAEIGSHSQATIHKGRNRDTAWFSILDSEWPAIKTAFEHWLAPRKF